MPSGVRETFKIEIVPDFSQKKSLRALEKSAAGVRSWILAELIRQYNQISLFQSEEEMAVHVLQDAMATGLSETSVRGVVKQSYAYFLTLVKDVKGGELTYRPRRSGRDVIDLPKDDVIFSTTEPVVRIPYLGLVRYRPNQFIVPGPDRSVSENMGRLWQSVRSISLTSYGSANVLLVDCRSREAPPTHPRIRKRTRKLPGLLG